MSDVPVPASRTLTVAGRRTHVATDVLGPGAFVERFEIVRLVGQGGMGAVYEARDPDLARAVAIKVIPEPDAHRSMRLLREAQALAQLQHPNVVAVHEVGTDGERVYIAMELVDGDSLDRHPGPQPWRAVVARLVQAGRGLAAAHAKGLVHRDVKPSNILVGADGRVRIGDFGLARSFEREHGEPRAPGDSPPPAAAGGGALTTVDAADDADDVTGADAIAPVTPGGRFLGATLTGEGAHVGTPRYMAPEQHTGRAVTAKSDQFSFCVAMWELVHGQHPFGGDAGASATLVRRRAAGVPRWLSSALERGLANDPGARHASMTALCDLLEETPRRRRRIAVGAVAGVVVASTVAVAWQLSAGAERPAPALTWTERQLTFRGDVAQALLSPDGTAVAAVGSGEVFVLDLDGGAARTVLRGPVSDRCRLAWSEDGRRLLVQYAMGQPKELQYQVVDVATGSVTAAAPTQGLSALVGDHIHIDAASAVPSINVSREGAAPRVCALPQDVGFVHDLQVVARRIYATVERRPGGTATLLVTDPDCGTPAAIATTPRPGRFIPLPDGRVVAVRRAVDHWELQTLDPTGVPASPPRPLPTTATRVVGARADGDVVVLNSANTWRLVDSVTGTELTRGTTVPHLVLAPDLRRIAIVDLAPGQVSRLYVSTLEALRDRSRSIGEGVDVAAWSPDGHRIAGLRRVDGIASLIVIDPATGIERDLGMVGHGIGWPVWLDDHRVAYPRGDQATYDWIDLDDGTRGTLMDPSLGQVYRLDRSVADDTLAVVWNRKAILETWIVPPAAPAFALRPTDLRGGHRWSPDGAVLWLHDGDGGAIDRYDPTTRQLTRVTKLDLPPKTAIIELLPLSRERVLIQTMTTSSDLVRVTSSR